MPLIDCSQYRPPFPFTNGHIATIYPALNRKIVRPDFIRERIHTVDKDFLDIDTLSKPNNKKVAFLFHGLEGNTDSQYMKAAASLLYKNNYDVIATNFRGCSGVPNNKINTYHSGFTDDVRFIIESYAGAYDECAIIGYSLGGNVSLKYLGEAPSQVHASVKTVIAVSVPIDLSAGSQQLKKKVNYFYAQNFLKTLNEKMREKDRQFPNQIDISLLDKVKTIWDFDEYFSAPLNGFDGAEDYYSKANSLQFLPEIKIPAHLVSSLDDPFLSESCFPFAEAKKNKNIFLHAPKYGGHVGFYERGKTYWIESKIAEILELDSQQI